MKPVTLAEALGEVLAVREKHAQIATSSKGFFVHVRVPDHVAAKLQDVQRRVLPSSGEPQDIDHVTLVYTRKALEDHPPEKVHAALESMRQHGQKTEPIDAKIQGWAYFDSASKDGKPATALVALVDAPGLEHLHVDLSRALEEHGIEPSDAHIFTPHITLGYLPQHGRAEKPLEPIDGAFTIDKVHVAAHDHHEVHLTGAATPLGQKAAAFALSPVPRGALVGAGIGAGAGALGSALDYATDNPDERAHQPLWKRMLINGGIGAAGGGLIGAVHRAAPGDTASQALGMHDATDQYRFASLGEEAAMHATRKR